MNAAHFHLILNHIPVITTVIGFLVLVVALIIKNPIVRRTSLVILTGGALAAIPANISGDKAEQIAEEIHMISHEAVEHHEEEAETFLWSVLALGAVSLFALLLDVVRLKRGTVFILPVLALNVLSIITGFKTSESGGKIRHPEIIKGWTPEAATDSLFQSDHDDHHQH